MQEKYRPIKEEEREFCKGGTISSLAGTYSGKLLILGGGEGMWEEFEEAKKFGSADIMATNMSGLFVKDKVKHLFSFHEKEIPFIKKIRVARFPDEKDCMIHGIQDRPGYEVFWDLEHNCSFSGLGAIFVGRMLGYTKIILCGIPMDGGGYYYQPYKNEQTNDTHRLVEMKQVKRRIGEYVRSMSGVTADIFGKPTKEWLGE